jgi:TOMM system kinase/cyclase fusion protein
MTFDEILREVLTLVQRQGRMSYRALKRRFELDDQYLDDLKEELSYSYAKQVREEGLGLEWIGEGAQSAATGEEKLGLPPIPTAERGELPEHDVGSPSTARAPGGDRRQITVMFCDLVGSTPLSEQLDPEELRDVIESYRAQCDRIVERYEGYVAEYHGDGLLVYFGYPAAHEDDARRALHAGLHILDAMERLNEGLGAKLQVRIGIHTGLVVAGGLGKQPVSVVGRTPNVAARVQAMAQPGTLLISEATHRLIEGFFRCRDLGPQQLKGISEPVGLHQVLEEVDVQSRLEIAATRGLTPLVGREGEVSFLLERWEQIQGGQGQVVLLTGEAGIGKSRLVHVAKERIANEKHTRLEARCSPYHRNSALYPAIDLLQRALQFERGDSAEEKFKKLERQLRALHDDLPREAVALLAALLSLPASADHPVPILTPQRQKERTLHVLISWLLKAAQREPVFLIVEDLHWADPSMLELLGLLLERVAASSILVILTFRPEFNPPWRSQPHLTRIGLSRLGRRQVEEMILKVASGKSLPHDIIEQVAAKTDGVPLFIEELTKALLESGGLREEDGRYIRDVRRSTSLTSMTIPATLSDSLMARLDRLASAKDVAQLGAVIGKEFRYDLLRAVSPMDEATLRSELARLIEAELLYFRGEPLQERYSFKHALIRDAAYQSLLLTKRQQYHQHIAEVLEERFAETQELAPEILAHHYTEGRSYDKAINYWHRAGQKNFRRSANAEAISHLTKGLELVSGLPDSHERTQRELMLRIALGGPLVMTKGYAAEEVEQTYARAQELCESIGATAQLFPVLVGLWVFYLVRAELQKAHDLGKQLLELATSAQDPALLLEAHNTLGHSSFYRGEFVDARRHSEECVELYDVKKHRALALLYVHDPGVFSLNILAWTLWHLGYPAQGLQSNRRGLSLAETIAHPFGIAQSLFNGAALHQLRREPRDARERAERDISVCTEQGFPFWAAAGAVVRGWADAELGREKEGISRILQGIASYRSTGARLGRPYFLALLAEAYDRSGQANAGLAAVEEGLRLVSENGEGHHEAELYRLRGELLLKLAALGPDSRIEQAQACFRQALDVARRQGARAWQLRAAMSLFRLSRGRAARAETREQLEQLYGSFTEGFETADLTDAKALLEGVASGTEAKT